LTIRESARSTDVRSTRVNDWQPEAADLPLRWVGRRGPGRLLVSRPVSPHRPSGWCAARGSARKPRHREPPVPSGAGVRKVRPSTSARLNHVAGTEASAARRSIQGAARRQRRAAESHGSALREGPPPPVRDLRSPPERMWTVWCSQGHPKSSHRDTISAVAGCFGLVRAVGERIAQALFGAPEPPRSTRWCQRRPRLERLDPGSGRMQRRRTPALGQGAETSNASALSGGQKIARPSRLRGKGFGVRSTPPHGGLRGSNALALNRCGRRSGEQSPGLLKLRPICPPGRVVCSVTSPLRCRPWRRFGARGTSQPPGCEVSSSVELPRVRQ
jgi:hypothetical protein